MALEDVSAGVFIAAIGLSSPSPSSATEAREFLADLGRLTTPATDDTALTGERLEAGPRGERLALTPDEARPSRLAGITVRVGLGWSETFERGLLRRHPEINEPTPQPSLRAQRSNPGAASRGPWIASSQELLAMTGEASPSSRFGNYWASPQRRHVNVFSTADLAADARPSRVRPPQQRHQWNGSTTRLAPTRKASATSSKGARVHVASVPLASSSAKCA